MSKEIPVIPDDRIVDHENPWPGLSSFTESICKYFHGREAETRELFQLVKRGNLIVLFGKSGLGKTSILNAGLFPLLRTEQFLPISIRINFDEDSPPFSEQVKSLIIHECMSNAVEASSSVQGETLWEYFHRVDVDFWNNHNRYTTPVLIFDQFEEIFTRGRESAVNKLRSNEFLEQLSDLIDNRYPDTVNTWLEANASLDSPIRYDFDKQNFKIILAVREDYLADLSDLNKQFHTIMDNRLRLQQMSGEKARNVMKKAGGHLLEEGLADRIIAFISRAVHDSEISTTQTMTIDSYQLEPALLSLVCRELNNKRLSLEMPRITADLLTDSCSQILEDFYERSLADLGAQVQTFIEERLLTNSGYRSTAALEDAIQVNGINQKTVDMLVDRRLLRYEYRFGARYIELIHDSLTDIVRDHRDQRRQREALQEETQRRFEMKKRLRRLWIVIVIFMVLTVGSSIGGYFGIAGQKKARKTELKTKDAFDLTYKFNRGIRTTMTIYKTIYSENTAVNIILQKFRLDLCEILKVLITLNPENTNLQLDLKASYDGIGNFLLAEGKRVESLEFYWKSLSIIKELSAADPDNTEWQHRLTKSYNLISKILMADGRYVETLKIYRKSLAILKKLTALDPENFDWQRDMLECYIREGDILMASGMLTESLESYKLCNRLLNTLLYREPNDSTLQMCLAKSKERIGSILLTEEKRSEALEYYQDALAILKPLVKFVPVGSVLLNLNQSKGLNTQQYFQDNLTIPLSFVNIDPNNAAKKQLLATIYNRIGDVLFSEGRHDKSLVMYQKSLNNKRNTSKQLSDDLGWKRDLSISYSKMTKVLQANENWEEAGIYSQKVLSTLEQLARHDIEHAGWLWDWTMTSIKFQDFLYALESSLATAPDNPLLWNLKGKVLQTLLKNDQAIAAFTKAIKLGYSNSASQPKQLELYLLNRARIYHRQGHIENARSDLEDAIKQNPNIHVPKDLEGMLSSGMNNQSIETTKHPTD